jgi:hypothetical protein
MAWAFVRSIRESYRSSGCELADSARGFYLAASLPLAVSRAQASMKIERSRAARYTATHIYSYLRPLAREYHEQPWWNKSLVSMHRHSFDMVSENCEPQNDGRSVAPNCHSPRFWHEPRRMIKLAAIARKRAKLTLALRHPLTLVWRPQGS